MLRTVPILLAGALPALSGCVLFSTPERKDVRESPPKSGLTVGELDQLTKNLSHRFVLVLADACDRIKDGSPPPAVRRQAHRLKLESATAAYDMVTGPDPIWQLLNLATLIELEAVVWGDEGGARRVFGNEGGEQVTRALESARKDLWGVASQVLTPPEIELVRDAIHEWRRRNPDVLWTSLIRFDVITQLREQLQAGFAGTVKANLGKFNPSEGREQVDTETRQLLGHAFFYFKQLPTLLRWQAEGALEEAVATVESAPVLEALEESLKTAGRALERVTSPASEEALALDGTLRELRRVLEAGEELAAEARGALEVLKPEPDRDGGAPKSETPEAKPFDIDQYRMTLRGAAKAAEEATELVRETRGLAESEEAIRHVRQVVDDASRQVTERGRQLVDHLTWRAVQLILLLALLVAAALGVRYAGRKRPPAPVSPAHPPPT